MIQSRSLRIPARLEFFKNTRSKLESPAPAVACVRTSHYEYVIKLSNERHYDRSPPVARNACADVAAARTSVAEPSELGTRGRGRDDANSRVASIAAMTDTALDRDVRARRSGPAARRSPEHQRRSPPHFASCAVDTTRLTLVDRPPKSSADDAESRHGDPLTNAIQHTDGPDAHGARPATACRGARAVG